MRPNLLEIIVRLNPWYKHRVLPQHLLEEFKRREFDELYDSLRKNNFITLLVGGRRVGKSVLLFQLIDELFKEGVNYNDVLFIQGDHPTLQDYNDQGLLINEVIAEYKKFIQLHHQSSDTTYVFIDETQAIKNWPAQIKALFDLDNKLKFFLTCSSNKKLKRRGYEALTGRVDLFTLATLSFADFYKLSLEQTEQTDFQNQLDSLRPRLSQAFSDDDPHALQVVIEKTKHRLPQNLDNMFEYYLLCGGYPWVAQQQIHQMKALNHLSEASLKYLRDLSMITIYRDIFDSSIDNPQSLGRILTHLGSRITGFLSHKDLVQKLKLDERTINKYVDYFIDSHLVHFCQRFSTSINKLGGRNQKIYLADTGLVNYFNLKVDLDDLKEDFSYRGCLIENCLYNLLLNFQLTKQAFLIEDQINFYEDNQTGKEIDCIYKINKHLIAIEVKSKATVDPSDVQTLQTVLPQNESFKYGLLIVNQDSQLPDLDDNILPITNYLLAVLL